MPISRREALHVAGTCVAHVFVSAACVPRRTRAAWTGPQKVTVTTTPFATLDVIGSDTWAVISTPLGEERTTFGNGGIIAGRSGVIAVDGY